ncbi:dentin sialophosphoprotein isoform X2 [Eurytemora carolleeae]|uniref:dentin sialophosphoprotein isoform X2 n=1 Tax=Eurytemora carolleeae TaxID=1294199 RepID=UPI000C77035D|nr:dentin sialophosphoprotein isoform X2 [Eurytemora carolleeae]|eukprot:XP_023333593.1 dentin sialophosphoprotein-like isoform X2 [Eurytemora affinis]
MERNEGQNSKWDEKSQESDVSVTDEIETNRTFNTSDIAEVAVTETASTSLKADSITPTDTSSNVMRNVTASSTNAIMGLVKASPNVSRKVFGNTETNKTDETTLSKATESTTTNIKSLENDKPELGLNNASESPIDLNNSNISSDNDLNKEDEDSANAIVEASLKKSATISDTTGSSQITVNNSTAISTNTDDQAQNKANKIIRFSEEVKNNSSGAKPSFRVEHHPRRSRDRQRKPEGRAQTSSKGSRSRSTEGRKETKNSIMMTRSRSRSKEARGRSTEIRGKAPEAGGKAARSRSSSRKRLKKDKADPKPGSSAANLTPTLIKQKCSTTKCRKKLGLTSYPCRCLKYFCSNHISSSEHECEYNYHEEAKSNIRKQNPRINGEKIKKI